jgi:hypothetical protein
VHRPWISDDNRRHTRGDIISFGGTSIAKYIICASLPDIGVLSARTRRCGVAMVVCGTAILIVMLGAVHLGRSADAGLAGCTALSDARQVAVADYPRIRYEFARSQWSDLRTAGTSYVDLAVEMRNARGTDGYETVWFYQRLSITCARHSPHFRTYRPNLRISPMMGAVVPLLRTAVDHSDEVPGMCTSAVISVV